MNRFDESKEIFKKISLYKISNQIKNEPRGIILNKKYTGELKTIESTYAFISVDRISQDLFCYFKNVDSDIWDGLEVGQQLIFNIAFNFKGPICIDVQLK